MQKSGYAYGDIFFDKYRELERLVQQKFDRELRGSSPIYYLIHKPGYEKYSAKLECCREIRNLISHYPKEKGAFPIEPSVEMVHFLEELIYKMSNRMKCTDAAVLFRDMYWRSMEDSVADTMTVMRERSFNHVPIIDRKKVVGIFDTVSLFHYLADRNPESLEKLTFGDIRDYLGLEGRKREIFTFHHQFTFLDELQEEFQRQYRNGKRIAVAFLTHTGRPEEDVIGMLTAWDVLGKQR